MGKDRLAAFSDGVIAILITIMVLELKVPHGAGLDGARSDLRRACSGYVLSFVYLAIYWNNHHHLLHTVVQVDGLILWANSASAVLALARPGGNRVAGRRILPRRCRPRSTASRC